ncbi:MAG: CHAT domain-containing protein [Coleofasciculaceae cyanobacterium]
MALFLKFFNIATASLLVLVNLQEPINATTINFIAADSNVKGVQSKDEIELSSSGELPNVSVFKQALDSHQNLETNNSKTTDIEDIKGFSNLEKSELSYIETNNTLKRIKKSLETSRKSGDRDTELKLLIQLGQTYNILGNYREVIDSAIASLSLARELKNSQAKVTSFVMLAEAYQSLASNKNEYQKATSAAISGLTAAWDIDDRQSEAKVLSILADVNNSLKKRRDAVVFAQQGFKIAEQNNMPSAAASSLLTLASVNLKEGNYQQTIELTQKSQEYLQKLQEIEAESAVLVMQSLAYYGQGSIEKSTALAEKSLLIAKKAKSPLIEALGLIVLSLNSNEYKNFQKALELINQSRIIASQQNNQDLEAFILEIRGNIYRNAGDKQQAIASYQAAISLNNSYTAQAGLARIYQDENLLSTAITYYKQAINTKELQAQTGIPGIPNWLQASFPKAVQDLNGLRTVNIYRTLANLLLLQKRIPEAQQVLELLKQQELREYTGTEVSSQPVSLTITATEQQILKEYGSLIKFGKRFEQCQKNSCNELEQLSTQREELTKQYSQAVAQLDEVLRTRSTTDPAFINPSQFALKAQAIAEEQPNTVLIYPLVLPDKIWLLWASKGGILKSIEVTGVTEAQLEVTVLRFRQLVQNRSSDINELKATGKQLYDWLIKPVELELKANKIQNLVFSLDRSTRYIPMAALYDGEKFMVENYAISTVLSANMTKTEIPFSVITSTTNSPDTTPSFACGESCRLAHNSAQLNHDSSSSKTRQMLLGQAQTSSNPQNPRILGLGVSEAVAGFEALPNVPAELDAIVRQESSDTNGIYLGEKFLNKSFDFFTLRDNLANRQILHIATHSEFVPGRAYKSFLLLGTGEKLAIPDIETGLNLRDVNLVVLSACETALGGPGLDGREIAGIAYYFLNSGAKTVMASLWRIDDLSTRLLMERFYQNLAKGTITSPVTKAEALRQAQLALLTAKPTKQTLISNDSSQQRLNPAMTSPSDQEVENNLPTTNKSYFSHPYYWASFILMGSGGAN